MGMKDVGTLKELGVCVGDVVEFLHHPEGLCSREHGLIHYVKKSDCGTLRAWDTEKDDTGKYWEDNGNAVFRIISRASQTPKLWRDMTADEKGALLLAHHERRGSVEFDNGPFGWSTLYELGWRDDVAYRILPEPKVETVTLYGKPDTCHIWDGYCDGDTYSITFTTRDGKPDCASVKMEEL